MAYNLAYLDNGNYSLGSVADYVALQGNSDQNSELVGSSTKGLQLSGASEQGFNFSSLLSTASNTNYSLGFVDGAGYNLASENSGAISYPYALTVHGEPDPNSVMFGNQFGTTGQVSLAEPVLLSGDIGAATVDWAAMDAAQDWINDIALHTTANSVGQQVWEFSFRVDDSGQTGTFTRTLNIVQEVSLSGLVSTDSGVSGSLGLAISIAGTVGQDTLHIASVGRGVSIAGVSDTTSSLSATIVSATLEATSTQDSELVSQLGIGQRISALSSQDSESVGKLILGLPFSGSLEQDSEGVGSVATAISLSATSTTTSEFLASLGLLEVFSLQAASEQASELTGLLTKQTGQLFSTSSQSAEVEGGIHLGLPLEGVSAQAQGNFLSEFALGISLSGSATWSSETSVKVSSSIRLTGTVEQQATSYAGLYDPNRFQSVSLFTSEVEDAPLLIAGKLSGVSAQESEATSNLGFINIFRARSLQDSEVLGALGLTQPLAGLDVQSVSGLSGSLSVPALNSTGWLTATDIFLHNTYSESLTISRIRATDIHIQPTLKVNSIRLKPE